MGVVGRVGHEFVEAFGGKTELHGGADEVVDGGDGHEALVEVLEEGKDLLKVSLEEFFLKDLENSQRHSEERLDSLAHEPVPNPQHVRVWQRRTENRRVPRCGIQRQWHILLGLVFS